MNTKAIRLYGKGDLRLEEFELPEITEDEIPLIFIRVRSVEQLERLLERGNVLNILTGFNLPKFSSTSAFLDCMADKVAITNMGNNPAIKKIAKILFLTFRLHFSYFFHPFVLSFSVNLQFS